jgi:hypothetical protein
MKGAQVRRWKIILTYIFLVGMPLLAVLGILRRGARLTPPITVRGVWVVTADSTPWHGTGCSPNWTRDQQQLLTIAQAGRDLTIAFNNPETVVLFGTIQGSALEAASPDASNDAVLVPSPVAACAETRLLRFQASVAGRGKSQTLSGSLGWGNCAYCARISFSAVRQSPLARSAQ